MHKAFRRVHLIAFLLLTLTGTVSVPLRADDTPSQQSVQVLGWDDSANPAAVSIYDLNGHKLGTRDLSGLSVAGAHSWNADYDLVELQPGAWVPKAALRTVMCEGAFAMAKTTGARGHRTIAAGMGSGTGCQ